MPPLSFSDRKGGSPESERDHRQLVSLESKGQREDAQNCDIEREVRGSGKHVGFFGQGLEN